jgi:phosphoglycerol transferase MdoB-like AlkP superfamily enzyme
LLFRNFRHLYYLIYASKVYMIAGLLNKMLHKNRFTPVFLVMAVAIIISFLTRLTLLLKTLSTTPIPFSPIAGSFAIGLFYDFLTAAFIVIPLVLQLSFISDSQYKKPSRYFVSFIYAAIFGVVLFTNLIPKDFNKDLYKVVLYYFLLRLLINLFLGTRDDAFRFRWRRIFLFTDIFVLVFLLLFNAISEYFFWDEFSTRYNFIAVDYLVYTNEVIGNIQESYPVIPIIIAVAVLAAIFIYFIRKLLTESLQVQPGFGKRMGYGALLLLIPLLSYLFVNNKLKSFSSNAYANELAGNGLFDFATAFFNNELDFFQFYKTLPNEKAFEIVRRQLSSPYSKFTGNDSFSITRKIDYPGAEKKMNIVLISVESLSANFMGYFGNTENITPNLDALTDSSLFFDQFYASGTRTVRGLEAMALSIPPSPGQSIVKRPNNANLFSFGSVLAQKGYTTNYIYGGYSYFDNMNNFFGGNGYKVIDRAALKPAEIHYENIWGVADEDLFTLSLRVLDSNYAAGRPFFSQIMTVSNHRPYTYPANRIDIPPTAQTRAGAVKYTDYAIGQFLTAVKLKPWFNETIFVVVADHCAGSSGSAELPVTGYHIPCFIYSPKNIIPQKIHRLVAQIDLLPTLLGLMNMDYTSKFFGMDIFTNPAPPERLFISTYQGLGYLKNNQLVIQKPVKKVDAYLPDFVSGNAKKITTTDSLAEEAIAVYQVASWLIKNNGYGRLN